MFLRAWLGRLKDSVKKRSSVFVLLPVVVSACASGMGPYALSANDVLANCVSAELIVGVQSALDAGGDMTPELVADGVVGRCDTFYDLLEDSLILDGEKPDKALEIVVDAKAATRQELHAILTGM